MRPSRSSWPATHDEQPLRLGGELFLLGLKDRTGEFELSDRAMALTLGGAELAELSGTESIRVAADGLIHVDPQVHAERGSRTWDVLRLLSNEQRMLGSWIQFLALTSVRAATDRLGAESGFLDTSHAVDDRLVGRAKRREELLLGHRCSPGGSRPAGGLHCA